MGKSNFENIIPHQKLINPLFCACGYKMKPYFFDMWNVSVEIEVIGI
jgi:hypothetical protein